MKRLKIYDNAGDLHVSGRQMWPKNGFRGVNEREMIFTFYTFPSLVFFLINDRMKQHSNMLEDTNKTC